MTEKKPTAPVTPTRPIRWEDDISSNADDTRPFENGRPISEWKPEELKVIASGRAPECLRDLPLLDLAAKDTLPIPNSLDREGYAKGYDEWFWLSGLRDYHLTMQAAERFDICVDKVLEIGCASGRVLRHYAVQRETKEVWGTDINHRHIRWLFENMPRTIIPVAVPALPQLPVPDNYFDLITAYSVFTHLDVFETAFLAEIRRALKPGGLAYLTAHTEPTWDKLREEFVAGAAGLSQRLKDFDPDFPARIMQPLAKGRTQFRRTQIGPYRAQVFHSTDYIENVWGRFFEIEDILPLHHEKQTVVLVRKPT